jgi:plastocyanin
MTSRRRTSRALVAFVVAVAAAIPALPALANHGGTTINVGEDNTGDVGRNNYHDSDISVAPGTTVTFNWVDGFHDVVWFQDPSSSLSGIAPTNTGSFDITMPSTPGEYLYYCAIHLSGPVAGDWGDVGADTPAEMVGRITVVADTTAPVWDAGSASATPVSASQIDLSWPTATDDSGSVFFDVYQASGATDPGKGAATLVGDNVSGTAFSASGLSAGVHYWFWITPVDGAGNEGPDLAADATTSSVAASATAETVLSFSVNPTLTIQVDNAALNFGTLSPAAPSAVQSAAVTVSSNDTWSLSIKSTGRDGVDDVAGDDAVFTDDSGLKTIPIARASWDAGSGANPLTEAGDVVATGQSAPGGAFTFDYQITLDAADPVGVGYATTVLYTATQP